MFLLQSGEAKPWTEVGDNIRKTLLFAEASQLFQRMYISKIRSFLINYCGLLPKYFNSYLIFFCLYLLAAPQLYLRYLTLGSNTIVRYQYLLI